MSVRPPCAGKWELFDSYDLDDHAKAAAICETCPLVRWCASELAKARLLLPAGYSGPSGTWAGKLIGRSPDVMDRGRLDREESLYDDREAKDAHAAYMRGDRGAWAETGHRVYDRRLRRAKKARRAAERSAA